MKSMTGYASGELVNRQFQALMEIKSCNNRYLDVSVHIPYALNAAELKLRERITGRVNRGRVDVMIRYKCLESEAMIHVDRSALAQYDRAFREIMDNTGITDTPTLQHFISMEDVLKPLASHEGSDHIPLILEAFDRIIDEFEQVRLQEGLNTRRDIENQLGKFIRQFLLVSSRAGDLEKALRENLLQRFEELTEGTYDQNRVLSEIAVMLVKYSINEEIQRTESHLAQFRRYLEQEGPVGKKLDFLCQELNREINTIASKSTIAEVNQAVVEMKDSLENIREQLRNVE